RRRRVTMLGRAGHFAVLTQKCCAKIVGKIDAPKPVPIRDAQALKLAQAGLRVNPVAFDQWRAARPGRAWFVLKRVIHDRPPKFLGVFRSQCVERFLAALVIEMKHLPAGNHGRSEPFADLEPPQDFRLGGQPPRNPSTWCDLAVARWA